MTFDIGQIARFGIVGILASAVHFVTAMLTVASGLVGVYGANAFAFAIALFVSYVGHHHWTFGRKGNHAHHFPRFTATALLGFALNQAIILFALEVMHVEYWIGFLIVVTVVPPIVYGLCQIWAFAHRTAPNS